MRKKNKYYLIKLIDPKMTLHEYVNNFLNLSKINEALDSESIYFNQMELEGNIIAILFLENPKKNEEISHNLAEVFNDKYNLYNAGVKIPYNRQALDSLHHWVRGWGGHEIKTKDFHEFIEEHYEKYPDQYKKYKNSLKYVDLLINGI